MVYARQVFLILILIAGFNGLNAQLNSRDGTLVTREGDVISGRIIEGGSVRNSKYILFRRENSDETIKYYPGDIQSYSIDEEKYYVSMTILHNDIPRDCFLEVLIEGKVSLYHYGVTSTYYIEKKGGALIELKNEVDPVEKSRYQYPISWKAYKLGTTVYKDSLYSLFIDCIPVLNNLDVVEYNRKSLTRTTRQYLDLTCQDDGCLTYEKDLKIAGPVIGVYSGVQVSKVLFYTYLIDSELTPSVPFGIFYSIPLSFFSENISFQLECNASMVNYKREFINLTSDYDGLTIKSFAVGVPFSVNYKIKLNKFSPHIGFGKETSFVIGSSAKYKTQRFDDKGILRYGDVDYTLHKIQKGGWFADAGVNYKINNSLSFYSSIRLQHFYNLIIEDGYYNTYSFDNADSFWNTTKYETFLGSLRIGIMF